MRIQLLPILLATLLATTVHAGYPDDCLGALDPSAPECPPALTYDGCCDAQGRVVYCQGGALYCLDCPGLNPACGWKPGKGYNCGTDGAPDPSGIFSPTCNLCDPPCAPGKACGADGCEPCEPGCAGKSCGPDGCGGLCGTCPQGHWCDADGACAQAPLCTAPTTLACGQTVTGDTTGTPGALDNYPCTASATDGGEAAFAFTPAVDGTVRFELTSPDASLRMHLAHSQCTPAACFWSGAEIIQPPLTAGTPYYIVVDGPADKGGVFTLTVVCESTCVPECAGKECGSDGCFGQCGGCAAPAQCWDAACTVSDGCLAWYLPGCSGCACESCVCSSDSWCCEVAWDELCAGTCHTDCGGCEPPAWCGDSACAASQGEDCETCPTDCGACPCQPQCAGKECGHDGCGGDCGPCPGPQEVCVQGACVCAPACSDRECGPDGCGGSCGACPDDACADGRCPNPDAGATPDLAPGSDLVVEDSHETTPVTTGSGGCTVDARPAPVGLAVAMLALLLLCAVLRWRYRP